MAKKQDSSSRQKEQKATEKRLRKNERRLSDRLQAIHKTQSKAIERLQRAEARVQKIMLRAKRMEERLIEVRLQLEGVHDATASGVELVVIPPQEQPQEEAIAISSNITQFPVKEIQEEPAGMQEQHSEDGALRAIESAPIEEHSIQDEQSAHDARIVAENTEAETRASAERAQNAAALHAAAVQPDDASQVPLGEHSGYPTPEEFARVEEITLAEENIEIAAAMSAAEAAGVAAANAEALAEAISARANEARLAAQQADHFLEQVRNAISDEFMQGEEAERALRAAEDEATYAHALLADAEAEEERARNEAMNAEAEAEVAEGMSLSANEHAEDTVANLDLHGTEPTYDEEAESANREDEATARGEGDADDDPGDTEELQAIHMQEHE